MANAAAAMAGMVDAAPVELGEERPLVAASQFGVTTPCITTAREELEARGYEVLTFHMTGTGGRSMESLMEAGYVRGVLDVTTTELVRRARRRRLLGRAATAWRPRGASASRRSSRWARSTWSTSGRARPCPREFDDRNLYVHNAQVTLMRTTPEECAQLGREIGEKLSRATGPTALFIPLRGVSMIAVEGGPFHDAAADEALFAAVREATGPNVELDRARRSTSTTRRSRRRWWTSSTRYLAAAR